MPRTFFFTLCLSLSLFLITKFGIYNYFLGHCHLSLSTHSSALYRYPFFRFIGTHTNISGSLIAHEYILSAFKCSNEDEKRRKNTHNFKFSNIFKRFPAISISKITIILLVSVCVCVHVLTYRIVTIHPISGYTSEPITWKKKHEKHFNINFKLTTTNKFMNRN